MNKLIINQQIIDHMPGLWVAMDFSGRFLALNQTALQWTGFVSKELAKGLTYADMPCKASEKHEEFIAQDKLIIARDGYGRILGFYCYHNDDWKVVIAEKYPLIQDKKKVALVSYIIDITHFHAVDMMKFFVADIKNNKKKFRPLQHGYLIESKQAPNLLTPRELECLFFILRGSNSYDLSQKLSISKRTVEKHIEHIKIKFQCTSKSALIEKSLQEGYLNIIPQSLLSMPI